MNWKAEIAATLIAIALVALGWWLGRAECAAPFVITLGKMS